MRWTRRDTVWTVICAPLLFAGAWLYGLGQFPDEAEIQHRTELMRTAPNRGLFVWRARQLIRSLSHAFEMDELIRQEHAFADITRSAIDAGYPFAAFDAFESVDDNCCWAVMAKCANVAAVLEHDARARREAAADPRYRQMVLDCDGLLVMKVATLLDAGADP